MIFHQCKMPEGRICSSASFTNDGSKVLLCNYGAKFYDCRKEKFEKRFCKFSNSVGIFSHREEKIVILNASLKGIKLAEFAKNGTDFVEVNQVALKGTNTDGTRLCFSADDQFVFFCIDGKSVWRYTCRSNECICLYRAEHPRQMVSLDVYKDQLLVILRSGVQANHNGFEVIDKDGHCLKSLRYDDDKLDLPLFQMRWIDEQNVMAVYPTFYRQPHDTYQIIPWQSADLLEFKSLDCPIERYGRSLYDVCISPQRHFIAYIWMDLFHGAKYVIGIYNLKTMEKVGECVVNLFTHISFSNNDKYLFICAAEHLWAELPE